MKGTVFCDGGALGNPGPGGSGTVLYDEQGREVATDQVYLGPTTNNLAEYHGLLLGLNLARKYGVDHIHIKMDSELVVRQVQGRYKVKHPGLLPLWREVMEKLGRFSGWDVTHVPREENRVADQLVREIVRRHAGASGR